MFCSFCDGRILSLLAELDGHLLIFFFPTEMSGKRMYDHITDQYSYLELENLVILWASLRTLYNYTSLTYNVTITTTFYTDWACALLY